MAIKDVILDFDGTCTVIPEIQERFLEQYLIQLNKLVFATVPILPVEWAEALQFIRDHSPQFGWTFATTPAAPAAADPYILAYESTKHLLRVRKMPDDAIPKEVFVNAAGANPAPWRCEAKEVFEELLAKHICITFISNTSSTTIVKRLEELFSPSQVPKGISVKSDANKYRIAELLPESKLPSSLQEWFNGLPASYETTIGRPAYLRRAFYFEALCAALDNNWDRIPTTVVCGDIWEMDLAMPFALGTNIHLIERAAPFGTYKYESDKTQAEPHRAKISKDLTGLLEWLKTDQ